MLSTAKQSYMTVVYSTVHGSMCSMNSNGNRRSILSGSNLRATFTRHFHHICQFVKCRSLKD